MFDPGPCVYMEKMAGGPHIADLLDLDRPLGETIGLVAERKGTDVGDVMVVVLDRPRHEEGIEEIRKAGGRVRLITDGDVSAALLAVAPDRPGRPAVGHRRHAGGRHLRRRAQVLRRRARSGGCGRATTTSARPRVDAGYDLDRVLTQDDLVKGDNCFFSATGRDRRRRARGRPLRGRAQGATHGVAGHAQPLGHGAARSSRATTAPSCAR